jgi:hypothetical protein
LKYNSRARKYEQDEKMKKRVLLLIFLIISISGFAQTIPESLVKAFEKGDHKSISIYFNDNIEMQIIDQVHITSKNQASRILQSFFKDHPPLSFKVNYEGNKQDSKYGMGTLATKKGTFQVNFYFMEGKKEKIIYYLSIEKA